MDNNWEICHGNQLVLEYSVNLQSSEGASDASGADNDDQQLQQGDGTSCIVADEWRKKYLLLRRASAMIGASTVAIDNKIEQAMDLVKSHLMFAVREEVEVLREQIKELLEKNSQLEYENSILRAAVPPEILVKLSQPPLSAAACAAATHQHQPPPNLM